ncbi:acid protease [Trametopsis cervina]|nr:acid protease [Trametopsis cervina]
MLSTTVLFLLAAVAADGALAAAKPNAADLKGGVAGLEIETKIDLPRLANVVVNDLARAAHFKGRQSSKHRVSRRQRRSASVSAANTAVAFTTKVQIGQPATEYTLLLDSGSANTWIGANKAYVVTDTSQNTGESVSVTYGSGGWSGTEYRDKFALGSELVIGSQSIGVANESHGFDGTFDGILGLGPTDLTRGTVKGSSETIPTVLDNLSTQKSIATNAFSMFLPPYTSNEPGSLDFGDPDSSKYTGEIQYVPITQASPANAYWGIDQTIRYGDQTILDTTAGIVDSGTTFVLLASGAFNAYKQATGATLDNTTHLLMLPRDQYSALQPLTFTIGGVDHVLSPNAQIWPRSANADLGGDDDHIYLIISNLGAVSGEGLDFILGYTFMERFYTVFDAANSRVGFANTKFTDATDN